MYPEVEYSCSEKVTISTEVVEVGRTTAALQLEDFTLRRKSPAWLKSTKFKI
jgi:hypothetical protein